MLHKMSSKLCRLCGKEKQQGTDVFKDKVKGAVLVSIINKYFSKEVIIYIYMSNTIIKKFRLYLHTIIYILHIFRL